METKAMHVGSAGGGYYADMSNVQDMLAWAKSRMMVAGFNASTMWKKEHDKALTDFLLDPAKPLLICYVAKSEDRLVMRTRLGHDIKNLFYEAQYFVRNPQISLSPENIVEQVQYGVFCPNSIESLTRLMDGVFVPFVVGNTMLPGSVRRSLTGQMHRFMANLTETSHSAHGRTVLYLPQEASFK